MSLIPRLLQPSDIPAAMELKEAAGWNQTPADWQRLLELEPAGCFAIDYEDRLGATATVVCYGEELAWIGMVLTWPPFRGRGLARLLMEQAIDYCRQRGVAWMRLDATDMGAPLYAKLGFQPEAAIERWFRPTGLGGTTTRPPAVSKHRIPRELDREAFGADRSQLLDLLSRDEATVLSDRAFAMGRPGSRAAYFGPCVCRDALDARELLSWYLARHPAEPVAWDILPANSEAVRLAQENGFQRVRELVRMSRRLRCSNADVRCRPDLIYATAGFEFG